VNSEEKPPAKGSSPSPRDRGGRALFDALPLPVCIRRASEPTCAYVNPAYVALVRAGSPEEAMGRPPGDAAYPARRDRARRNEAALAEGDPGADEVHRRLTACDGTPVEVDVYAVATEYEGSPAVLSLLLDTGALADAEAGRDAARESYRSLVERSPDAILVHTDGVVRYMNQAGIRMFGFERLEDAIGLEYTELMTPESRDSAIARVADLLQGRPMSGPALRTLLRRDGSTAPGEATATRLDYLGSPSIQVVIRDVTEREEARRAQAAAESRAQAIIDSIPVGMHFWVLDPDGELVFAGANAAADRILGIDHEPMIGMPIAEAFPMHASGDIPATYVQVVETGVPWHNEDVYYRDGRIESSFDVHAFRIGPGQMVAAFVDITERARIDEELGTYREGLENAVEERTIELSRANRELEQATKAKSSFLASMSHELRTPLNSIIGFSGVLQQGLAGPLDDEQLEQIGMINTSGRRLLELVNDILDLASIEAGRARMALEEFDVGGAAAAAVELVRPLADAKDLSIEYTVAADVGGMYSDPRRVGQILVNLLGNAVKFTPEGGVTLEARRDGGRVTFVVTDTGLGVPHELKDRVFEEYFQVNDASNGKPWGTGLGLSLSRRLARLLGGDLELTRSSASGSAFTLWLPVWAPKPRDPA
jgi:PAS domain S-box-containing protein